MIFPPQSNTAYGRFRSFDSGSRRQKFKPLNTRIKWSFISRETEEPILNTRQFSVSLVCSALQSVMGRSQQSR